MLLHLYENWHVDLEFTSLPHRKFNKNVFMVYSQILS